MAAISANGGAERYWRHAATGTRLVLCRNGEFLINPGGGSRWVLAREPYTLESVERDRRWQPDTRPVVRAAVTRTSREALRRDDRRKDQ
jgi:hypothetical protein